jgi:hypothetical protein
MPADDPIATLLHDGPRVLNVGVHSFAETLQTVGAPHLHIDWQPPAQGENVARSAVPPGGEDHQRHRPQQQPALLWRKLYELANAVHPCRQISTAKGSLSIR